MCIYVCECVCVCICILTNRGKADTGDELMLQLGNPDNYTHKMPILLKGWGEDVVMIQTI